MKSLSNLLISTLLLSSALAADKNAWKQRTIYQLLTDRYHKTSGGGGCGSLGNYCGGTWKGIEENLDYI